MNANKEIVDNCSSVIIDDSEVSTSGDQIREWFDLYDREEMENFDCPGPRDLYAFNLLNKLVPMKRSIIDAAVHDKIYLGIQIEQLVGKITRNQVQQLCECYVHISYDNEDYLEMFV